jgi:hypothetical protein
VAAARPTMSRIFRAHRARWVVAVAVLAVATAALPAGLAAVPVTAMPLDTLPDAGTLRLHLGSSPQQWRLEPLAGGSTSQAIGFGSGCNLAPTAGALVALTPTPASGKVGLTVDGIGVRSSGEGAGVPCGRVNGDKGQRLLVELAGTGPLATALIDFMELDIEAKGNVIVVADLFLDGTLVGSSELPTGTASDSGPDSGDGDNYRFRVPETGTSAFDSFVLRPKNNVGEFSLAGGADGTTAAPGGLGEQLGTTDSVIHLKEASGILDCGDSTGDVTGGNTTANFARGQNPGCEPIPYLLRVENDDVLVQKDLSGQAGANFTMTVTWDAEPAPENAGVLTRTTFIDYTPDTPGDETPLLWCDAGPTPPPGEFWCLTAQSSELQSDGTVVVTEDLFGAGDPRVTRG